MTLETKQSLSEETIPFVQDLIQVNIDSAQGFTEAADDVNDATVAAFFRESARERESQAEELQRLVSTSGHRPEQSGSAIAAAHRKWLQMRAKASGGDAHAVLEEAARGEEHIKNQYETALKHNAGSAVNDLLQRQLARVKATHQRVRELRDARKG